MSDVHGNLPAMEAALALLRREGAELLIDLGDLVHFGPDSAACFDLAAAEGLERIQGNCDRALGRGRRDTGDEFVNSMWARLSEDMLEAERATLGSARLRRLAGLPEELRYELEGRRYLFTHGLPGRVAGSLPANAPDDIYDYELTRGGCDVLTVGHTHETALHRQQHGWILNPGSVGGGTLPRAGTVMLLEPSRREGPCPRWLRVDYDFEAFAARSEAAGIHRFFTRSLELGRDLRGAWHTDDFELRQRWADEHSPRFAE